MTPALLACTSGGLACLEGLSGEFSCWLHFPKGVQAGLRNSIMSIARMGCRAFLVSGPDAAGIHDQIDDVLESIQENDIPTAWYDKIDEEVVWDFLNLDFGAVDLPIRIVGVISDGAADELEHLGRLVDQIRATLQD
jgi:hypothetical protein